jgi:hypothetical protein
MGSWKDWTAGHIEDPLLRLRFLRAVAPPPRSHEATGTQRFRWPLVFLACLLGVPASLLLARAAGGLRHTFVLLPTAVARPSPVPRSVRPPGPEPALQPVWQVERNAASETYSNGLRIDSRFTVENHERSYRAVSMGTAGRLGPRRADPAGIVFHTTESMQVPFEAGQNSKLKRLGESLLDFIARHRAYHFVIDRFGRVYRVVPETDAANHAGHSVWSDDKWVYVNLNESFLGIAFEAQTPLAQGGTVMSPAQVRAGAMLTEMLRSRYQIEARNCVTHAQVSVNPSKSLAGYHTDWASGFPFEQIGLPNNYAAPLAAIALFGFAYDPHFANLPATALYAGVERAEQSLRSQAAASRVSLAAFRKTLQKRFHDRSSALSGAPDSDPGTDLTALAAE